jgi:DNA-binding response OmpR family regulator
MMNSILIVNRNSEELLTLSGLLAGNGHCVIAKTDPASALLIMGEGLKPDVVISDYMLPGMDALNFITSLKRITGAHPPVIFLSDHVNVGDYLAGLSAGAFEFLFKPVHPRELLRIVHVAMERGLRNPGGHVPENFIKQDGAASVSLPLFE